MAQCWGQNPHGNWVDNFQTRSLTSLSSDHYRLLSGRLTDLDHRLIFLGQSPRNEIGNFQNGLHSWGPNPLGNRVEDFRHG